MAVVALCALVAGVAYRVGRARADGVPTVSPLYYGGMLDDGGTPVSGTRNLTVRVWDAATGGTAVCTTAAPGTTFSAGRFRVALDAACAGAVRANPNLWAEVQVDTTTFPRTKLGAVPYALEAGRAAGASGPLETRIAALEGRDGGVAPGGSRQVEIGMVGTTEMRTNCNPAAATTAVIPLTVTAAASALYRVSAAINASSYSAHALRIIATPAPTFLSQPMTTVSGNGTYTITVSTEAIVRLEAGQSYTFSAEYFVFPSASCNVRPLAPIVVAQLN